MRPDGGKGRSHSLKLSGLNSVLPEDMTMVTGWRRKAIGALMWAEIPRVRGMKPSVYNRSGIQ